MRTIFVLIACSFAVPARADGWWRAGATDRNSVLGGPLVALRIAGPGPRIRLGFEGGVGFGVIRVNAGIDLTRFVYVEVDPWYLVGGTFGIGLDADNVPHTIIGLWEGMPLYGYECGAPGWNTAITAAAGYRYTGAHELYVTVKAGALERIHCGS